ncbi:MAG: 50S ribosome-binding GTPase, partial [Clostridia bacterium]|nr:50S ribosome-binding GTPase [Clostridia bacterium]
MSEKIIALVGNPNTGKTTFFNTVAKTEEHVGNWHGVTV